MDYASSNCLSSLTFFVDWCTGDALDPRFRDGARLPSAANSVGILLTTCAAACMPKVRGEAAGPPCAPATGSCGGTIDSSRVQYQMRYPVRRVSGMIMGATKQASAYRDTLECFR